MEVVALLALLALLFLVVTNWDQFPIRLRSRRSWDVRTALQLMSGLGVLAYLGMSIATHYEKLIHIPEQLDRAAPHMRQLVFSMGIMLKSVLMLVSLYLVWVLVNVAQGNMDGLGRGYTTGLVLVVLLPFAFYMVKLRRRGE